MKKDATTRILLGVLAISSYLSLVNTAGLSCYKCQVPHAQVTSNDTNQLCTRLDGSDQLQTYCDKSTMCMKRSFFYTLPNGTSVTIVERGCAPQRKAYPGYDESERRWYNVEEIDTTVYNEGCFTFKPKGGARSEYCYCSYHLCNGSQSRQQPHTCNLAFTATICVLLSILLRS